VSEKKRLSKRAQHTTLERVTRTETELGELKDKVAKLEKRHREQDEAIAEVKGIAIECRNQLKRKWGIKDWAAAISSMTALLVAVTAILKVYFGM